MSLVLLPFKQVIIYFSLHNTLFLYVLTPGFTPFLELLQIHFTLLLENRLLFGLPSKKKQVQSQSILTTTPTLRLRTERKWCVNSIRLRVPSLDTNFAKPLPRCTQKYVIACATSGWRRANVRGDGLKPPPLFHARLRIIFIGTNGAL